jgi:hypothetical protein
MSDQWHWWRQALAGNFIEDEIKRGNPQSGFYRDRSKRAVAIWRDELGALMCSVTSGYSPRHADEIDELFGFVLRTPISDEVYERVAAGEGFPEDVEAPASERGIGDNSASLPLHESIAEEINRFVDSARDWLKSIGGKVETQQQADKAANYAEKFQALEKKADAARVDEKKPYDDGAKAVQERWKPVVALAAEKKGWMKKALETFLTAERRRKEEEARQARIEAEKEAEIHGEAPPPPPPPVRVNAGTRGKVALRSREDFIVSDLKAFGSFLLAMENPPPDLVETLEKIARRMGHAGTVPPGVERRVIETAA